MQVEIWSDVVCPWCAVGRARFQQALADFAHADEVEIRWRSFELDPSAPRLREVSQRDHLATKYRRTPDEAQAMLDQMTATAAEVGLEFRFDRARAGNTLDAHRLLHLAFERGGSALQDAVKDRFLTGYLRDGEPIGEVAALTRLAVEAGLDEADVTEVLAGERFTDEVREDETQARVLGISGVPFFVLDARYGVSGAQPAEVLLGALQQAWQERSPLTIVGGSTGHAAATDGDGHDHPAGDACSCDSCAV
ncbi:MAG: DsbA family oxidoreductase [Nitriliruptor sp.]|uniref:DsbA family oxidoreductase n=1 Tax=Nitriliruptor sp. TaxID=2448056 RepID=UPI0034A0474D